MPNATVLVVDDEALIRWSLTERLKSEGYYVLEAETGRAALERVGRCAEVHLAEVLTPLDPPSRRRLQGGLGVLRKVFATSAGSASAGRRRNRK